MTGMIGSPSEFCRRFLACKYGVTFADLEDMSAFLGLEHAQDLLTGDNIPFKTFKNDEKSDDPAYLPQVGDVLYSTSKELFYGRKWPTLSMVTAVDESHVYLSEQQWRGSDWQGDYVRKLAFKKEGELALCDEGHEWMVVAWKRVIKPT